jgi:hypothetical protein
MTLLRYFFTGLLVLICSPFLLFVFAMCWLGAKWENSVWPDVRLICRKQQPENSAD